MSNANIGKIHGGLVGQCYAAAAISKFFNTSITNHIYDDFDKKLKIDFSFLLKRPLVYCRDGMQYEIAEQYFHCDVKATLEYAHTCSTEIDHPFSFDASLDGNCWYVFPFLAAREIVMVRSTRYLRERAAACGWVKENCVAYDYNDIISDKNIVEGRDLIRIPTQQTFNDFYVAHWPGGVDENAISGLGEAQIKKYVEETAGVVCEHAVGRNSDIPLDLSNI